MFKIKDLYIYTAVLFCFSFTAYGKGNGEGIISDTGIRNRTYTRVPLLTGHSNKL